jgi:hypothetical protein
VSGRRKFDATILMQMEVSAARKNSETLVLTTKFVFLAPLTAAKVGKAIVLFALVSVR